MLLISEGTVKVYLSRLFQKVGVKDRFELALYGLKNLTTGHGTLEKAPVTADRSATPETAQLQDLRALFLEHPWHDPELSSRVFLGADGAVGGFIGVLPLRMTLRGMSCKIRVNENC